jgi:hypothetical protein
MAMAGGVALLELSQIGELAELDVARFPSCSSQPVTASSDAIAFLKAGMTVSELTRRCPAGVRLWDASFENIVEPVVVVRVGDVPLVATFYDTLPGSKAWAIRTGAKSVKTRADVGVGSSIEDLLRAYGQDGEAYESECHVFAEFTAEPGIVWELRVSPMAECNELLPGEGNGLNRVPPRAVVKELRQVGLDS